MAKRKIQFVETTISPSRTRTQRGSKPNITTAVTESDSSAACEQITMGAVDFLDDAPQPADPVGASDAAVVLVEQLNQIMGEQDEEEAGPADNMDLLTQVKFADEIKIDFIPAIDYRILCRFLGVTSVNDVKNHPFSDPPLITFLLMESLQKFMESKGYEYAGELNFSEDGYSIPPEKNPWLIKGKETTFTVKGFQYFEKIGGSRRDNIAFYLFTDLDRGGTSITCFSTVVQKCKEIINELKDYTKRHNCLRGAKLKDINMVTASFSEVEHKKEYTWDNYYFTEDIRDLFESEVFGFLRSVQRYNENGIYRRGLILHGRPGTGKTTIGHVICHYSTGYTVIWITPETIIENQYRAMTSMKLLYKLADYLSPCAVIIEDLDLIGRDREEGGDITLGSLMNILDGVNSINNSVTIGTTNRLGVIEKALRNRPGRFDRIVEIPPMEKDLRSKMFSARLSDWTLEEGLIDHLVGVTEGWTPAEVQEFVNGANLKYINSDDNEKNLTKILADEVIAKMHKFGIGEVSGCFGFGKGRS